MLDTLGMLGTLGTLDELVKLKGLDLLLGVTRYVRGKLLAQGNKCIGSDDVCAYKIWNQHCAVGWLIPEGHAAMHFGGTVTTLINKYPDLWFGKDKDLVELLSALQLIHDKSEPKYWPIQFDLIEKSLLEHGFVTIETIQEVSKYYEYNRQKGGDV